MIPEPLWLTELRAQVRATSQRKVALEIGYSPSTISQVLTGKYPGDLTKVEAAVRGVYLGETLNCPVLGEIGTDRCLQERQKPYSNTSPVRVKLYRACRSCPHNPKAEVTQ